MYNNIGNTFIRNGQLLASNEFNSQLVVDGTIYEVIRVLDGRVLFLKDHMTRLKNSLTSIGKDEGLVEIIEKNILQLVEVHKGLDKNIKIDVYKDNYRCYFMESNYPLEATYKSGVETVIFNHQRSNPSLKQLDMSYKTMIETLKKERYFEVILQDENGYLLEGSRSNLLFVKKQSIYTPPLVDILEGITFKNMLLMAKEMGYHIVYEAVNMENLDQMEGCFITGTSLGVLPVRSIDGHVFESSHHPIIESLMNAYKRQVN